MDYLRFVGLHKFFTPATKVALVDRPLYLYIRREERKWIRHELSNGEGTAHGHLPYVRRKENAVLHMKCYHTTVPSHHHNMLILYRLEISTK